MRTNRVGKSNAWPADEKPNSNIAANNIRLNFIIVRSSLSSYLRIYSRRRETEVHALTDEIETITDATVAGFASASSPKTSETKDVIKRLFENSADDSPSFINHQFPHGEHLIDRQIFIQDDKIGIGADRNRSLLRIKPQMLRRIHAH